MKINRKFKKIKDLFNKNKAYIGAIGDDLPSLIPIFIGLTLFFSVFLTTYNVYKDSTDLYGLENEAIQIGLKLKQEPVIYSYEMFQKSCNNVKSNINWNAFIVDTDLNSENYRGLNKYSLSDSNLSFENIDGEDHYFKCKDLDEFRELEDNRNAIIYFYPVTLQKDEYSRPARLYVMAWD